MESQVLERLEAIERRLARLETAVFPIPELLQPESAAARSAPGDAAQPCLSVDQPPDMPTDALGPSEQPATTPSVQVEIAPPSKVAQFVETARPSPAPPVGKRAPAPPRPARPPMDRERLERLIGSRVIPIVGAIAALVGVSLFLKLGYDLGWFDFPPAWRCIFGFGAGAALVGVGEVVRRKLGSLASAPVSALGLACMFAAVVAAHLLYALVAPSLALTLLFVVSALGVGVALRARVRTVAVLSFLGAYAAPFLLDVPEPEPIFMPVYLSILMVAGIALSMRYEKLFGFMRTMNTAASALMGTLITLVAGQQHPIIHVGFLTFVWALHHATLALLCVQRDRTEAVSRQKTFGSIAGAIVMSVWWAWLGAYTWSIGTLPGSFIGQTWHVTGFGCVATLAGGLILAGHLRAMLDTPRTHAERFGAGLTLEAGGLLFATIALALSGWTETLAWTGVGVAAALAARWLKARSLLLYAAAALIFATARVLLWDHWAMTVPGVGTLLTAMGTGLGLVFSRWMLLAVALSAGWFIAAECGRRMWRDHESESGGRLDAAFRGLSVAMGYAGVIVLGVAFAHPEVDPISLAIVWAVIPAGFAMLHRITPELLPERLSPFLLTAPVCVWIFRFANTDWIDSSSPMVLHPGLLVLTVLLAAGGIVLRCLLASLRSQERASSARRLAIWPFFVIALLLTFGATSLEVTRMAHGVTQSLSAQAAWLAVWWSCFAAALSAPRRFIPMLFPERFATGILAGGTGAWLFAFANFGWFSSSWPMVLHPGLLVLTGLLASGFVVWRRLQAGVSESSYAADARRAVTAVFFAVAFLLTLAATSLEVARIAQTLTDDPTARAASVSIWWGVFAAALITFGMLRSVFAFRSVGLALLAAALGKVVIYDLGEISPAWRIASFVAVGGLMLVIGVWYTSRGRLSSTSEPTDDSSSRQDGC